MTTKILGAVALLVGACGGDDGDQRAATPENLQGIWTAEPDGDGRRAFEFALEASPGAGHPYRLFLYPPEEDAVEVQRGTFDVVDGVLVTTIVVHIAAGDYYYATNAY